MKKILFIILLNLGLLLPVKSESMLATVASYVTYKTIVAAASLLIGYKWLRSPNTSLAKLEDLNIKTYVPSKETNTKKILTTAESVKNHLKSEAQETVNVVINDNNYLLESGFPQSLRDTPEVCIALGGSLNNWEVFTKFQNANPGGYAGYRVLKADMVKMPCITFDCITEKRKSFNFCQEQDLNNLDMIVKKIRTINKNAKIVLVGTCKGGSLALRYLAEKAEKDSGCDELSAIKAVVAEGPPNSVKDAIKNQPGYPISLGMAKACPGSLHMRLGLSISN